MVICWIITLVLILVVGRKLTLIPTNKFVNTVEYGYQFVRNDMGEGIIGHGFKKHVPFLATLFFFILISNFVGLIPGCKTPTGTISVTWALATISFVYFNVWGIKAKGGLGLPEVLRSGGPSEGHGADHLVLGAHLHLHPLAHARRPTLRQHVRRPHGARHLRPGHPACSSPAASRRIEPHQPACCRCPGSLLLIAMYALETLVAFLQAYVFTVLSAVYVQIATSAH